MNAPLALQYPPTFDSSTPCVPHSRALIGFCALPCAPSPSYAKVPSPRGVGFSASRLLVARQTCTGSRRPRLGVQCNHCRRYLPATATGVLLLRTHRPRGPGGESWAEIVSSVQTVSLPFPIVPDSHFRPFCLDVIRPPLFLGVWQGCLLVASLRRALRNRAYHASLFLQQIDLCKSRLN